MEHRKAEHRTSWSQRNVAAISGTGTVCGLWFRFVVEDVNVLNIGMCARGGCMSTRAVLNIVFEHLTRLRRKSFISTI
jgi:hypothetical protein